MSFVKDVLSATKENNGLRGIFSIILVATILTVFELGMFYKVITPEVAGQVDSGIRDIGRALNDTFGDINNKVEGELKKSTQMFSTTVEKTLGVKPDTKVVNVVQETLKNAVKNSVSSVLDTFKEREALLTGKINMYTKVTGAIMLMILGLLMYLIYFTLKTRGEKLGTCTWIISGITVALILMFQYAFFRFGKQYKYIGSYGKEELLVYLMKQINV